MIRTSRSGSLLRLKLARDLTRSIKRGNRWVFAQALADLPRAEPGSPAVLVDKSGREVAKGLYDPQCPIAFRACVIDPGAAMDREWACHRLDDAHTLRRAIASTDTTGYRLLNGEGDGMPGLICDIYGDTAVMQFDGDGPRQFWDAQAIADWLASRLSIARVYQKGRGNDGEEASHMLIGSPQTDAIPFLEHGAAFTADIVRGQKTGFFLDQRENRQRVRALANGCSVLNVFGYTGGFSICAGLGGAIHVTTVDTAQAALQTAQDHWKSNQLDPDRHETSRTDAFEFLEAAAATRKRWGLVVLDPPSFAPSQKAVPGALSAYQRLIAAGAAVTETGGVLAAASCSSHVRIDDFLQAADEGISVARRRATILGIHGQPPDHPSPMAMPELRYLKFVLMRVE